MKVLCIFDSCVEPDKIGKLSLSRGDEVYLFPLASKTSIKTALLEKIKAAGCNVNIVHTAGVINSAAENLRDKYIRFIARLPERVRYKDKNLKEYFAIDRYASLWWFSLISEKNTYKSDTFNRLVQLDSIVSLIVDKKIEKIIFWCSSEKLKSALLQYASENFIRFESLPARILEDLKTRILKFQKISYLRYVLYMAHFAIDISFRFRKIKRRLGSLKRASRFSKDALIVITPYPHIDISQAQKGIFKNKFYPCLQERLETEGQDIIWIAMYVESNSASFNESLRYAGDFIKNGYNMFFLEEFNSIGAQIKAVLTMFKNGLKFLKIERDISKVHTFGNYNFYSLFKDDWYVSFAGYTGYSGILYYSMFRFLLSQIKARKCLYLLEMHAWEKALISARKSIGSKMSLYGYQFSIVPRMLLNFFSDPSEIADKGFYAMPRPEKIIYNGPLPYSYMKNSGWPETGVSMVEAIKYNHLKGCTKSKYDRKKNVVLLVFTISPEESSSILNVVCESLKDLKGIEVWLRPHPFLQTERVFEIAGLQKERIPFQIKDGPIEDLLSDARVVINGGSGVSIEAIAHGCDVLPVNTPEWINMSPLKDMESEMVRCVDSPEELKQAVVDIFKKEYKAERYALEARRIVEQFFYLNQASDVPDRFLKLLKDTATICR